MPRRQTQAIVRTQEQQLAETMANALGPRVNNALAPGRRNTCRAGLEQVMDAIKAVAQGEPENVCNAKALQAVNTVQNSNHMIVADQLDLAIEMAETMGAAEHAIEGGEPIDVIEGEGVVVVEDDTIDAPEIPSDDIPF